MLFKVLINFTTDLAYFLRSEQLAVKSRHQAIISYFFKKMKYLINFFHYKI